MKRMILVFTMVIALLILFSNSDDSALEGEERKAGAVIDQIGIDDNSGSIQTTRANNWFSNVVDNEGMLGLHTSLALDSNKYPHVSYYDFSNTNLKYAYYDGSQWNTETVDSDAHDVGKYSSLALDSNDLPHISYSYTSGATHHLRHAKYDGNQWSIVTVDTELNNVGWYTSIDIDSNDYSHISYWHRGSSNLKYARWNGSAWEVSTVDQLVSVGTYTSLALDSNDRPHISYYDEDGNKKDLKYAHHNGASWQLERVDEPGQVGEYTSICYDDQNSLVHISYYDATNTNLKYAKKDGGAWSNETVDSNGAVGKYTSIAADSAGKVYISYYDEPAANLKYATNNGGSWTLTTIDADGSTGQYSSIAREDGGQVHISYYDATDIDLMYASTDFDPPSSQLNPISPYWTNGTPLNVSGNASDMGDAGVGSVKLRYQYSNDNASWGASNDFATDNSAPWYWLFNFPDGAGYYRFWSVATDNAGNAEQDGQADTECGYDPDAPQLTDPEILNGDKYKNYFKGGIDVTSDVTEAVSGVNIDSKQVSINGAGFTDNGVTYYDGKIRYEGYDPNANFTIQFRISDVAGNTVTSASESFNYDAYGPQLDNPEVYSGNLHNNWYDGNISIRVSVSDLGSGCDSNESWYSLDDGNTWIQADYDGNYIYKNGLSPDQDVNIKFMSKDYLGNERTSDMLEYRFDPDPPTSSVNPDIPFWFTEQFTLGASADDSGKSGVENVTFFYQFSADNISWTGWTFYSTDEHASWDLNFTPIRGNGYYRFCTIANDSLGNKEDFPANADVTCGYDDKPPLVDQDSCPDNWTTGDQYEFRFTLLDDLGISGAWISWQHGNMSEQEVMLQDNGDQTWSHVINLDHSVDDMNYSIRVVDLAGNKKAYGPVDVTVRDNDRPNLIGYNAPQRCTTGDEFTFTVNAEDNIDVEDVSMEWSHGNAGGNLSLQRLDDTTWECSVTTDVGSIEDLTYQIFIRDTAGNYRIEVPHYLPVKDNDPPGFQGDESGDNATTGDKFFFVILPFDNIKVSEVLVNWSHGEFNNVSHYLRDDGNGRWTGNITLDLYSVSELEYYVRIADDVGNSIETHHRFVPVRDDDTPLFQHETMEETPRTGETFNVTMILKDNIAIDKVWFKYTFQNREQLEKMMAFEGNDTWKVEIFIPQVAHAIEYHLIAEDGSGNRMDSVDHVGMIVKDVEDVITPVAVINSPVAVDQHQEVAFNGHGSADNMGIVNFTWRIEYDDDQVILFDVEAYFVFHKAGTWPVSLTVFDAYNNENTSWTEILVRDITPPFADAGENVEIGQGKEVVRAANVDDNVWVKTVIWSFDYDEKPREIRDIEFRWFFETPGIYNISLAVKDEANNIAIDFMIVTVRDTEPPHPVVFHGERKLKGGENDPNATQGDEIVLNGDASRDNVEIVEHRWVIKLGEDEEVRLGNELRYIFDNAGRYIIILVVKDEAGNDNETRFEIDVRIKDDENPVAHVNWEGEYIEANDRYEVKKGTTILFHAEDSTDNVGIAGFKWVVNGPAGHKQFTGVDMSYEFREVGTYAFKLTVTDVGGNQDMFEMTFEAMEEKPEGAEVGPITNTDGEPIAGATVTLDVDGETFTAVTDENGIAVFDTSFRDVPKGAKYIAEKDGERIEWEEGEARPNFLKSAEKEEGIPVLYLAIGAVVLMLIIIILFLVIRKRKRTGDGGAEGVGTTAAQGEEEGDLPEEEGGFEPVDKPPAEARKGKKKEKPGRKKADAKKAGKGRKKPGAKAAMETERVTETDYEDDEEEAEGEAEDEAQDEAEEWDDGDVEGEWDGEDWDDEETDDEEELELPPPPEDLKDHLGALTLEKVSSGIKNILPGYIITDKLGAGGFATVYKAINKDGDAVAIKMPKFLDETIDSSVLNKFRAESDIWKKLKHRNIVTFLDSDIRPVPYMAIELMEGGNLGGLLKDHRLSVQEAKPLMLQILDGLSYAHRMASVHRDIKPENILFTKDGIPKIADWGIGKFMASESVSQSIGTKGTFLYSAPEQFDKETYGAVDWSTDIFQIGVVFYEMLTGINPFKADELAAVMGRILTKQPEPPSSLNPEIPPELDEIVMTCLEKNKDDRWRSTDVLYSKLKDMEKRKQGSIKKYRRSLERALRDGTISDDEEAMLSELREHMGITDAEHRAMIDDISGEIFKIDA